MSKNTNFFQVWNNETEASVVIYGQQSLARFLRERGIKFDNRKLKKLYTEYELDFNEYTVEIIE